MTRKNVANLKRQKSARKNLHGILENNCKRERKEGKERTKRKIVLFLIFFGGGGGNGKQFNARGEPLASKFVRETLI